MKIKILFAFAGALSLHFAALAGSPYEEPGKYEVDAVRLSWHDAARDLEVPVKVYLPKAGAQAEKSGAGAKTISIPVIIFSHGLGGSREGYEYLGRFWASHGYASVHIQHLGSDSAVLENPQPYAAMREAVADPRNSLNRPLDVQFALDELQRLKNSANDPFHGRLNLDEVGVAGHSFGGFTVLAEAGETFNGHGGAVDPRIKAGVAISAPVTHSGVENGYDKIHIPLLHITGTEDNSPVGETKAADRRIPFDRITTVPEFLLIFAGADHMVFSGRTRPGTAKKSDPEIQHLTQASSTAFWDAYLRQDPAAHAWLETADGFAKVLGTAGTLEKKLPGK